MNTEVEVPVQETQTHEEPFKPFDILLAKSPDGRYIADIPKIPGVQVYGNTKKIALFNVKILALRVLLHGFEGGHNRNDPDVKRLRKTIKKALPRQRIPMKLDKFLFAAPIGDVK